MKLIYSEMIDTWFQAGPMCRCTTIPSDILQLLDWKHGFEKLNIDYLMHILF